MSQNLPLAADVRPTDTSAVKKPNRPFSKRKEGVRKQKRVWQLLSKINKRFVSASLDGPARLLLPGSLARPNAAAGGRFCLEGDKISFPGAIRAEASLQLLRFRGGENPARQPKQGTRWGPASESLRVVTKRPAEGEEILSSGDSD